MKNAFLTASLNARYVCCVWRLVKKGTKVVCVCVRHFRKRLASISGANCGHGTKVLGTFAPEERKFQGAKVPWNESSWNIRSWGAKVPQEQKFHGTKVLGLFAPRERMFHGTKVPRERKFSLWSFHSRERKCRGMKTPVTLYQLLLVQDRWSCPIIIDYISVYYVIVICNLDPGIKTTACACEILCVYI